MKLVFQEFDSVIEDKLLVFRDLGTDHWVVMKLELEQQEFLLQVTGTLHHCVEDLFENIQLGSSGNLILFDADTIIGEYLILHFGEDALDELIRAIEFVAGIDHPGVGSDVTACT